MSPPAEDFAAMWEPHELPADGAAHYRFGPLAVWVRRDAGEVQVYSRHEGAPRCERRLVAREDVPGIAPARFIGVGDAPTITPVPVMPVLSLVVKPDHPVHLLPDQSAEFFISVPIAIQFKVSGAAESRLPPLQTQVLSKTWFGEPTEGELCFSIPSRAKRQLDQMSLRPWRAICPLVMSNRRAEAVSVGGFLLQSRHLACYLGRQHLWTTSVEVEALANANTTAANYGEAPPAHEPIVRQLSPPRQPERRSLLARGLHGLNLTNLL